MGLPTTNAAAIIPIYAQIKTLVGNGIGGGGGISNVVNTDSIADKAKGFIGIGGLAGKKKCSNEGVTDKGIVNTKKWQAILNGASLALNTANSLRMAKLQRDLGKQYLRLAEEHKSYYNDKYKPLEQSLTKEALALPIYDRNKESMTTGQMLISARGARAGVIDQALSCTGRYCTGQRAAITTDQLLEQASRESAVAGLAHRYTDKEAMIHDDLRWKKREQVMRIGRDIPTDSVSFASLAGGVFGSLGRQSGKAAEGAMNFLAYNRGNTQYPERRKPMSVSSYIYTTIPVDDIEFSRKTSFIIPEEPTQSIKVRG